MHYKIRSFNIHRFEFVFNSSNLSFSFSRLRANYLKNFANKNKAVCCQKVGGWTLLRGPCGWDASTLKLLPKIYQYLCNRTTYQCFVFSLRSTSVHLRNNTFILRKVVENLYDMAYQKYCKIVVSKESCLHYVTLPFEGFSRAFPS